MPYGPSAPPALPSELPHSTDSNIVSPSFQKAVTAVTDIFKKLFKGLRGMSHHLLRS